MRTIHTVFIALAFLASVITACKNPSDRAKGTYQQDYEDTVKQKKADSAASQPSVNPEDTIRRY